MFYGKGEEKTGIFQNPVEAKRDYELRDLAQGKTERHNFQGNLESNFKKCMGCDSGTQAWVLASRSSVYPHSSDWVHPGPQLSHSTRVSPAPWLTSSADHSLVL